MFSIFSKEHIFFKFIKQNNHRGETSFDCFGRVGEIGPPFSAEASCKVAAIPGQNGANFFTLQMLKSAQGAAF